jgi:hypothetical protein
MQSFSHAEAEPEAARTRPQSGSRDDAALMFRAAAAGRTDVLGAVGLMRLQRELGNAATAELVAESRSPVLDVVSSGGAALEPEVRGDMEARLGADFSDVRIHTDDAAHRSAQAVSAHAYTVGSDIAFQRDAYDPGSAAGQKTLAHELTHVIQQRSGPVDGTPTGDGVSVSDPSDRFEREAASNAETVMSTRLDERGPSSAPSTGTESVVRPSVRPVQRDSQSPDAGAGPDGSTNAPDSASATSDAASSADAGTDSQAAAADVPSYYALFVAETTQSPAMYQGIAGNVKTTLLDLDAGEQKGDPPSIAMDLMVGAMGAAITYFLPAIGGVVASFAKQELAKTVVNAAFKKGADLAKDEAKKVVLDHDSTVQHTFFHGTSLALPGLAADEAKESSDQLVSLWQGVGTDVSKAKDTYEQAVAVNAALHDALTNTADIENEVSMGAFNGLNSALARADPNLGKIDLGVDVADGGSSGGLVITSATINGPSNGFIGRVTGRPLSDFALNISITAGYVSAGTTVGDDSESDAVKVHTFNIEVDANGKAMPPQQPDQWLLDRGSGDATAGAQSLFADLQVLPLPLTSA